MNLSHLNLFLLGAPKCGTTSLAFWLSGHPNIFLAPLKEPNFFNTDLNVYARLREAEYLSLFKGANEMHRIRGEASTTYLRSEAAVPNILKQNSEARFIVCVRNPVEMAISLHGERVKAGVENERSFEKAWRLMDARRAGEQVPRLCFERSDLQYGDICKTGRQVDKLLQQVSPGQVKVVVFDDLAVWPRETYLDVLRFLEVPDDYKTRFETKNEARSLPPFVATSTRLLRLLKRRLRIKKNFNINTRIRKMAARPNPLPEITPHFCNELRSYFAADVQFLGQLIDRDLSPWAAYSRMELTQPSRKG